MKNWFKNFFAGDHPFVVGVINMVVVLVVALITKAFNSDVSVFTGVAFLVGFILMAVEWIVFRNSEKTPMGACIGVMAGVIVTYFLGV